MTNRPQLAGSGSRAPAAMRRSTKNSIAPRAGLRQHTNLDFGLVRPAPVQQVQASPNVKVFEMGCFRAKKLASRAIVPSMAMLKPAANRTGHGGRQDRLPISQAY